MYICIYVYICKYVNLYICIYVTCIYEYENMYIYIYICIYLYIYLYVYPPTPASCRGSAPEKKLFQDSDCVDCLKATGQCIVRMVVVFGSRSLQTHPRGPHERSRPKWGKCRLRGH